MKRAARGSVSRSRKLLPVAASLAAVALSCGLPSAESMVRVVEATPTGSGVAAVVEPTLRFSGPVAPDGLLDGRRFALVRASDLRAALDAVEAVEPAEGIAQPPGTVELDEGATRLRFSPAGPLPAGSAWALLLSSRALSADGRHVLDVEGRMRPTVVEFSVAALPPPAVLLTEVLADAATPEAGGEYAEVLNLGPGPLDLAGWRFEKRTAAGAWSGCSIGEGAGGPVAVGAVALVVGGSWDGRYALPGVTATYPCGATSLAGGIANDRPPELRLLDPAGAPAALLDATAIPACGGALEAEPLPQESGAGASCCRCTEGSPGSVPGR
jgi:hypothetical protein